MATKFCDLATKVELFTSEDEEVYIITKTRAGGRPDKRNTFLLTSCEAEAFRHEDAAKRALGNLACRVFDSKDFREYSPEESYEELAKVVSAQGFFEDDTITYRVESIALKDLINDSPYPITDGEELGELINDIKSFKLCNG